MKRLRGENARDGNWGSGRFLSFWGDRLYCGCYSLQFLTILFGTLTVFPSMLESFQLLKVSVE